MAWQDYAQAAAMRDLVQQMVADEVQRIAPQPRYGTVSSITRALSTAYVLFPGSTTPVPVKMGYAVQPQHPGQVVRVEGVAGDKYITDVIGPTASQVAYQNQHLLSGGGVLTSLQNAVSWNQRFIVISGTKNNLNGSGEYIRIDMPPDGTVIKGWGGAGDSVVGQTLSGYIDFGQWNVLWYDPTDLSNTATQVGQWYSTSYAFGPYVDIPPWWIKVVGRNNDSLSPTWWWGNGQTTDYWKAPTLSTAVNYGAPYGTVKYKKENGIVQVVGLLQTTAAVAANFSFFTLGAGYRPGADLIYSTTRSANIFGRLTVTAGGAFQTGAALASGDWFSVNASYTPDQ